MVALCGCLAILVVACGGGPQTLEGGEVVPEPTATVAPAPATTPGEGLPRLNGTATVEMEINGDRVTLDLDGTLAPITAGNFVDLVQRGLYDGVVFHRVVRDPEPFVVQGGDPQSKDPSVSPQLWGTGGFIDPGTQQERRIPLEITPAGSTEPLYSKTFEEAGVRTAPALPHRRGAVAMARSQSPDSTSSQFYFALADLPFLDGSYAVFGYVTEGLEVIDAIAQGDALTSARVVAGAENLSPAS